MKKSILALSAALAAGAFFSATADNWCYTYFDEDDNPMFGNIRRVSPGGKWAVGGDEEYETNAIMINLADPENPILDPDGFLLDVNDDGLAVGAYYELIGYAKYKRAAIYKDGVWQRLPLPEAIIGQSYAVAISADGKTIAGHGMCENEAPDEPGKYFPMVWKLNETTGEFDLYKLYNNLYLPGTSGFFIEDMTPDAKVICGYQCLDMGDIIAAMMNLETEEYTIWHTIEYREVSFDYGGTTYYIEPMFIDGLMDGFDEYTRFNGRLSYATDRYLFGSRGVASEVAVDGSFGVITNMATVYDLEEGTFTDGDTDYIYSCGLNPEDVFTNSGLVFNDGKESYISDVVGVGQRIDVIYSYDDSQRILTGSFVAMSGWGELYESPILAVLDEPVFAGIEDIRTDIHKAHISVNGHMLTVAGAQDVAVYDTNGLMVSHAAQTQLPSGIYVVVADGTSQKVLIK